MDDEPDKRAGAALKTDGRFTALGSRTSVIRQFGQRTGRAAGLRWKRSGRGVRCGSGPPLSATLESQPGRRAGTASNTDGTGNGVIFKFSALRQIRLSYALF